MLTAENSSLSPFFRHTLLAHDECQWIHDADLGLTLTWRLPLQAAAPPHHWIQRGCVPLHDSERNDAAVCGGCRPRWGSGPLSQSTIHPSFFQRSRLDTAVSLCVPSGPQKTGQPCVRAPIYFCFGCNCSLTCCHSDAISARVVAWFPLQSSACLSWDVEAVCIHLDQKSALMSYAPQPGLKSRRLRTASPADGPYACCRCTRLALGGLIPVILLYPCLSFLGGRGGTAVACAALAMVRSLQVASATFSFSSSVIMVRSSPDISAKSCRFPLATPPDLFCTVLTVRMSSCAQLS